MKREEKTYERRRYFIEELGKENSFKVPDGYFENLTSEVMNNFLKKKKLFSRKICQHMDKTETIALYGSYVRRGGLDYPGSVNRS